MQITGHMVDEQGNKVAGPTISGSFSGVLTVHFEDGSQRRLWEKDCPAKGQRRCLPAAPLQSATSSLPALAHAAGTSAPSHCVIPLDAKILCDRKNADRLLHCNKFRLSDIQVPVLRLGCQPERDHTGPARAAAAL